LIEPAKNALPVASGDAEAVALHREHHAPVLRIDAHRDRAFRGAVSRSSTPRIAARTVAVRYGAMTRPSGEANFHGPRRGRPSRNPPGPGRRRVWPGSSRLPFQGIRAD
jgi:hypothetical protein